MPGDAFSDIYFPDAGVDAQAAVGAQRPGTTPTGTNVRACEPSTRRLRGGARSGLSKYVNARPGGLTTAIQHLAVIVDHSADYLLAGDEANPTGGVPPSWVADPSDNPTIDGVPGYPDPGDGRNPGRSFPPGGSGVVPDPHVSGPEPGSDTHGWTFIQKTANSFGPSFNTPSRTDQISLTGTTKDQMLVLAIYTSTDYDGSDLYAPDITITDSLGNTWHKLTPVQFTSETPPYATGADYVLLAWARNGAGGDCTVSIEQSSTFGGPGELVGFTDVELLEYGGLETSTPFDAEAAGGSGFCCNDGSVLTGTMTAGAPAIGGQTRLVLGCFYAFSAGSASYTPAAGWTVRSNQTASGWLILEKLSSGSSEEPTAGWDHSASPFAGVQYTALAAGWRYR